MKLQIIKYGIKYLVKDSVTDLFLTPMLKWSCEAPEIMEDFMFLESEEHADLKIAQLRQALSQKLAQKEQVIIREIEI